MRAGADAEVLAARPVQRVVPRLAGPDATSSRSRSARARRALSIASADLPAVGDVVVRDGDDLAELAPRRPAACPPRRSARSGHVRDAGREHALERRAPRVVVLAGDPEDEVGADVVEPARLREARARRRRGRAVCVRPSARAATASSDCTPKLTRLIPASRYASSFSASRLSGLHSIVISASGASVHDARIAATTRAIDDAATRGTASRRR